MVGDGEGQRQNGFKFGSVLWGPTKSWGAVGKEEAIPIRKSSSCPNRSLTLVPLVLS